MKAILIFILSAAVVIQCQKLVVADAPSIKTHPYLEAKTEAWQLTYGEIAQVHYTYTGYAKVAAKSRPTDKGGQPAFGDSCGLEKAGKAYEDAQLNFRDARYSMRIEWNPYHLAKKTSVYNKANSAMKIAKKNYQSKLACDDTAFTSWHKNLTKNRDKKRNWPNYLRVERATYRDVGTHFGAEFMPGYVQGDKCGVRSKMYEYTPLQHITNWATFKKHFYGGSYTQKGNDAFKASRAKYGEYLKAVECDKAIPTPPAAVKEIAWATKYDIGVYQSFWTKVAVAKKRNDPCQLEAVATNFSIVEQTFRFYNHLRLSARTSAQVDKYAKLSKTAMVEQEKVGAIWQKALLCDAKDVAVKKVATDAAAAAAVVAELKDGENPEVAKCKAGSTKTKPSPAAKDAAVAFAKAKADQVSSFEKAIVRQTELHQSIFDMEVENTFEEHEKNFEVDGKESRRLWVFSN